MKFQADSFIKLRQETVPVYFGTLNVPAIVKGEAIVEIDRECEGASSFEVNYSVTAGLNGDGKPCRVVGVRGYHLVVCVFTTYYMSLYVASGPSVSRSFPSREGLS